MPRSYRHISNYENEILELKSQGLTLREIGAKLFINEYINFYNNYRIQTKTKLTPLEKRNQFVA